MDQVLRLRTTAAAASLGISPRTLEKWRLTGDGPRFLRIGRCVVYDTRDLDAFLKRCERRSSFDEPRSGDEPSAVS